MNKVTSPALKTMKPGIYFNMPEELYHADPSLSSSGIRKILVSPLDYWIESRLNPDYVDTKTPAMITGTAFHRRLLEPARFVGIYAGSPSKDDYPDAVDGARALEAECERLGLKKGGTIADRCERILEAEPNAKLWPVIEQDLLDAAEGKVLLKADAMADIERMARIVFAHESAKKALTGGYAEVSVFWTETDEQGIPIPMKARFDYLKIKAVVDIKSFSNPLSKPIDNAVASAVASGRYDVQAVIYDRAVQKAKEMLRKQRTACLYGADDVDPAWLVEFAGTKQHTFSFVFIEQGPVTNVKLREFCRLDPLAGMGASPNAYWQSGVAGFQVGLERYVENMTKFGPNKPWIEDEPMRAFVDTEFPMYLFG